MSNYFSSQNEWQVSGLYIEDMFNIFVSHNSIPGCDENCITIINSRYLSDATKICCLSLTSPTYYAHDKMEGLEEWVLNSEEKIVLLKALNDSWNGKSKKTRFEMLIAWLNEYITIDKGLTTVHPNNLSMPDYMQLPE